MEEGKTASAWSSASDTHPWGLAAIPEEAKHHMERLDVDLLAAAPAEVLIASINHQTCG